MLSFGGLLRLTPGTLQSSKRADLGVKTIRIRITNGIRGVVAVSHLKASDDLIDNHGIDEGTIRRDSNHGVRGIGLRRPTATWTYLVKDNPFGTAADIALRRLRRRISREVDDS